MDAVFVWDGAIWEQEPRPDLALLITRAAREFGWSVSEILDMAPGALMAMLRNVRRLSLEDSIFAALAFHDPEKIGIDLEEMRNEGLTEHERWLRNAERLRTAMRH